MTALSHTIPGATAPAPAVAVAATPARTVGEVLRESQIEAVMNELDRDLVGLVPVKQRIRDIAALLVIDKLRLNLGLQAQAPSLHMCFTGNPGTGKTTAAMRMAEILHRLGCVRKGHLVAVTRDDLVGQYIGHTAPKTKEVLKKAMGGVLFIDEAHDLYRPENERDYGAEAIEILLQVMENQRDDPHRLCRERPEFVQQAAGIVQGHHRTTAFIASVTRTVSTLTVVTRISKSTTFSLWSAKR
jgi:SpoVK/Ycf46/Vps4 family AAA+-type ATPase